MLISDLASILTSEDAFKSTRVVSKASKSTKAPKSAKASKSAKAPKSAKASKSAKQGDVDDDIYYGNSKIEQNVKSVFEDFRKATINEIKQYIEDDIKLNTIIYLKDKKITTKIPRSKIKIQGITGNSSLVAVGAIGKRKTTKKRKNRKKNTFKKKKKNSSKKNKRSRTKRK